MQKQKKQKYGTRKKKATPKPNNDGLWFLRNVVSGVAAAILIYLVINNFGGYEFVWNKLVKENLELIEQYPNITTEQKYAVKAKDDFQYLNFLKNQTPDSAIILMPPDSLLRRDEDPFKQLSNKAYCKYFVYPRKLVYERDKDTDPLYGKATHIAVFDYWGYQKLGYMPQNRQQYGIIPLAGAERK